jgi:hypothetical protein
MAEEGTEEVNVQTPVPTEEYKEEEEKEQSNYGLEVNSSFGLEHYRF